MPNTNIQTGQDWGTVNVGRASAGRVSVPKSAHGITRMKAMGLVATVSCFFFFRFLCSPVVIAERQCSQQKSNYAIASFSFIYFISTSTHSHDNRKRNTEQAETDQLTPPPSTRRKSKKAMISNSTRSTKVSPKPSNRLEWPRK